MPGLQFAEKLRRTCCQKAMWKGRLSSNACGMKSREAMGSIRCAAICRVRFRIKKPTQSSNESARNTQPFMDGKLGVPS